MTEKDIRPIPQSILKEIYKRDLKIDPWQTSLVRYYAYLAIWKKELVKVTVAVSTIQNKYWAYKQVAVHGIHTPICLVRDIEYNYFGFGYRVGWYAEELQTQQKPFEDGRWHTADKKYYDPYAELINRSVIAKLPEYKYSAYQYYRGRDIISYLRIYEKYPQTEYLLKLGLGAYAENLSLLKKIAKDKVFCKWFIRHRNELALPWGNAYNVTTITQAYKTGLPLKDVAHYLFRKKQFEREARALPIRELFKGWELKKYFDYIEKQNISDRLYLDYLNACKHLNVDMTLKQNLFPKDFQRWHDIRIAQYAEQKAIEQANKDLELTKKTCRRGTKIYAVAAQQTERLYLRDRTDARRSDTRRRNLTSLRWKDVLRSSYGKRRISHLLYPYQSAARKALCDAGIFPENAQSIAMLRHS